MNHTVSLIIFWKPASDDFCPGSNRADGRTGIRTAVRRANPGEINWRIPRLAGHYSLNISQKTRPVDKKLNKAGQKKDGRSGAERSGQAILVRACALLFPFPISMLTNVSLA